MLSSRRVGILLWLPLATVPLGACHPSLWPLHPTPAPPPVSLCSGPCVGSVTLTYLGVSGFVIRGPQGAIMTAPSFTHPNLFEVFLPHIGMESDHAEVDRLLEGQRLDDVSAILVGHSHYDHLLDVPYIAESKTTRARLYGSQTMANILAGDAALRARTDSIPRELVGTQSHAGAWIDVPGAHMRFMALASSHAPNLIHYTYADGSDDEPRTSLPTTGYGWHLGPVLAYLIDIVDDANKPVFRIFYQDAAADSEFSHLPPLAAADERHVDVAIICAGNFGGASNYPTALLLAVQPKHVIVAHWEDFFERVGPPFHGIRLTDTEELSRRLTVVHASWVTPTPFAQLVYQY